MAKTHSLREYISSNYDNEIWKTLGEYIADNPTRLSVRSYSVPEPETAELTDWLLECIDVLDTPDDSLCFDLIISAEIAITARKRSDVESDDKGQWFRMSCFADFIGGVFSNFEIGDIGVYDRQNRNKTNTLSEDLVPIIAKENFDDVAKLFLEKYYPEALKTPTAIDVCEIVHRMELEITETRISRYFDLFGEMIFSDGKVNVFDKTARENKRLEVKQGTILVDPNVYFMRNIGSWNNTIIHECVHWFKHRKYHWLKALYSDDTAYISCKVDEKNYDKNPKKWSNWDWMEWHANGIAPRILMPKEQTEVKIKELIAKNNLICNNRLDVLESVIYELSGFFGVSLMSAKIRMLDLGYKEAEGIFTYIDDRYIKNYAFKADAKETNQTFCIGLQESFWEYFANPDFQSLLDAGNFVYIDSHFVINDPKYVKMLESSGADLTDYAKQNMHECCLRFDLKLYRTNLESYSEYSNGIMFKAAKAVDCKTIFNPDNHNMTVFNRSEELKKFHTELLEEAIFVSDNYKTFSQMAWTHIERYIAKYKENFDGKTLESDKEIFRKTTLLSDKMFDRIKKGIAEKPELETVLAICFGLNLGASFSLKLLKSAGYDLSETQNPSMLTYHKLITSHPVKDVFETNELLIALGMKPLCEKEYKSMI